MGRSVSSKTSKKGKKLLIILMSAVVAIALGLTCALCFGNSDPVKVNTVDPEVSTATTYTDNKSGNLTARGAIYSGDVINFTTTGIKTVTLPAGTYQFEVWGAQGGGQGGNWVVGYGGYTKGTIKLTTNTSFWIVVGGKGANGVVNQRNNDAAGGYNGGGAGGRDVYDMNQPAGGGGGATHIATAKRGNGLLTNYGSYRGDLLMVAGGGGGTSSANPNNGRYGGGGGANNSGYNGWSTTQGNGNLPSNKAGGGGSTAANKGGAAGTCTTIRFSNGYQSWCHNGSAGGFGQGGYGGVNHAGGGGGGGGYFGGGGGGVYNWNGGTGAGDGAGYCNNAGGGSGYANTSKLTGISGSNGVRAGNGYARITVLNQAPETRNKEISGGVRGAHTVTINAKDIARDPDWHLRTSNSTENDVYFSAGAANRDTLPTNTAALYLNSACTVSASNFVTWKVVNNARIDIEEIKRYPRANADGNTSTVNGKLVLYARVRDAYGASSTRGLSVIKFTLSVTDNNVVIRDTSTMNTGGVSTNGYVEYSKNLYSYRLGISTSTSKTTDYVKDGGIYNTAEKIKTVFIPQPLTLNKTSGYTITAADIFKDVDADAGYDIVGFKSVSSASSSYYSIRINQNTSKYGSSGLGESITVLPTNAQPSKTEYVVVQLTAQAYEKAAAQGGKGAGVVIGNTSTIALSFKISNTRPVMKTELDLSLDLDDTDAKYPRSVDIKISDFLTDPDGNTPSFVMGTSTDNIKVPSKEYVSVNKENTVLSLANGTNYNKSTAVSNTLTTGENTSTTGEGNDDTGFNSRVLAAAGSSAASSACITYQYLDSQTLRITARAATQYMYKNQTGRKGHLYFMVRISDPGEPSDNGIWFPIAIKVVSTAPTTPQTPANFTIGFKDVDTGASDTNTGLGVPVVITPISYTDASGVLHGIGTTGYDYNANENHAKPFVTDVDAFSYPVTDRYQETAELNDVVALQGSTVNTILDATQISQLQHFFKVETVPLYAARSVFANLTDAQLDALGIREYGNDTNGYTFTGLKITPVRSTDNYYFELDVNVIDAHGGKSKIPVFILVENREVGLRHDPSESTAYPFNLNGGKYEYNADSGEYYINYSIEKSAGNDPDLVITPYDLAFDFDTATVSDVSGIAGDANGVLSNTNPSNSGFFKTASAITGTYTVKRTQTPNILSSVAEESVMCGQLSFTGIAGFKSLASLYTDYFEANIDTDENVTITSGGRIFAIPSITIRAKSRTTASIPVLRFSVSDGYTSVPCVIAITVGNSRPVLNTNLRPYYSLTAGAGDANIKHEYEFRIADSSGTSQGIVLTYDLDGDTPTLVSDSVRIVAYDEDEAVEENRYKPTIVKDGVTHYLSDYIYAAPTIGTGVNIGEEVILVRGLSSTQIFDQPIYLEFTVRDGYRANQRDAVLHVRLEVLNSQAEVITDTFVKTGENDYTWQVKYDYTVEKKTPRYLVNSEALYNSSAIAASPSNKVLLFSDPDAQQTVLLNPSYLTSTDNQLKKDADGSYTNLLVATLNSNVGEATPHPITEETFTSNDTFKSSAVIFTPTYTDAENEADKFISMRVIYYDDNFEPIGAASGEAINKSKYWAIEIVDNREKDSAGLAVQIALAVRDNHYNTELHKATGANSVSTSSDIPEESHFNVLNIFYRYLEPGITPMHEYYRTDGNAESATLIDSTASDPDPDTSSTTQQYNYVVDIDRLSASQFANGVKPATQGALKSAMFAENFAYQYFVNVQTSGDTKVVPKTYSSTPFYYRPIHVGNSTVNVPMSYLAMPQGYTENGTDKVDEKTPGAHVIFDNATTNKNTYDSDPDNLLYDSGTNYTKWNTTLVFRNMRISDGVSTWRGDVDPKDDMYITNNPYVTIGYVTNEECIMSDLYLNDQRGYLGDDGNTLISYTEAQWKPNGVSRFREDKFGFSFVKKSGGHRTTNRLTLTVDVKTSGETVGTTPVSVDLIIDNTDASISYKDSTGDYTQQNNSVTLNVDMTTSVTAGRSVELLNLNSSTQSKCDDHIAYRDPDGTDEVRFFMPASSDKKLPEVLNGAEKNYLVKNQGVSGNGYASYLGLKLSSDNVIVYDDGRPVDIESYIEDYIPNPGYKNFFTVSPEEGTANVIRFIPNAKTQLNLDGLSESQKADVLAKNHLLSDSRGIYYPFRALIYDDINGSGLTNGSFMYVLFKVYIDNDPLKFVNDTDYFKPDGASSALIDTYKYQIDLVKGVGFALDVSALFTDNDIISSGSSFAVSSSAEWAALLGSGDAQLVSDNGQLVRDYFIMPDLTKGVIQGTVDHNPVEIRQGSTPTTIIFKTDSAFKTKSDNGIPILYTFRDYGGSSVKVVFCVRYNNEAPTVNPDTYGNADTINITMKTGDSFTVHAADSTVFGKDTDGGYSSPANFTAKKFDYPTKDAATLKADFKYLNENIAAAAVSGKTLSGTDLILGSDDAPSTLRFNYRGSDKNAVATFTNGGDAMIGFVASNYLGTENSVSDERPMSVTFTARGVTNTVCKLTLSDGEISTVVNLNITVESTAPVMNTKSLPENVELEKDDNGKDVYAIHLDYNQEFPLELEQLVTDPDRNDMQHLTVPAIYDGSCFKMTNSDGVNVSAVEPQFVPEDAGSKIPKIVLKAIDYIPVNGGYTTVTFRVADAHGAQSEEINIRVYIAPKEPEAISVVGKVAVVNLKSVQKYLLDGSENADTLEIVSSDRRNAAIVYDPDSAAPSAMYNVGVYAVFDETETGTVDAAKINVSDITDSDNLIIKRTQAGVTSGASTRPGNNDISEYIANFFEISISGDGKTLTFMPNSATLKTQKILPISLYIRVGKPITSATGMSEDKQVNVFANVSVANSAPIAVENHAATDRDDTDFLSFTGVAGSSYAWKLYDLDNESNGLFYDFDKLNYAAGSEKIEYVSGRVLPTYTYTDEEDKRVTITTPTDVTATGDPVLSIFESEGNGVTVKINRKVNPGVASAAGSPVSTSVPVEIKCKDSTGAEASTVLIVNVSNDTPEFKAVSGNDYQYTLEYSEYNGYSMYISIPTNRSVSVKLADILEDADIDMDVYKFDADGIENGLVDPAADKPNEERLVPGTQMFSYRVENGQNKYKNTTMTGITFKCLSTERLKEAVCRMRLKDSTQRARTSTLTIHLIVGNTAPVAIPSKCNISIMGVPVGTSDADVAKASFTDIITNYVTDINAGDMVDANVDGNETSTTYIYLASKMLYTRNDGMGTVVYGPGLLDESSDTYMGENDTACNINWDMRATDTADMHQVFTISPKPGVYGVQKVLFTVKDDGYQNGSLAFVTDGMQADLEMTITIVRPISDFEDDIETVDIANGVSRVITSDVLLTTKSDPEKAPEPNATGYGTIKNITTASAALQVYAPESASKSGVATASSISKKHNWRVKAKSRAANDAVITVTFDVGGTDVTHDFKINVTDNRQPTLRKDTEIGLFSGLDNNVAIITPDDWFVDPDIDDEIRFVSPASTKISAYADVHIERNREYIDAETNEKYYQDVLVITFKNRGKTDLTVHVSDASNRVYAFTVPIECTDAPEVSFWNTVVAAFQESPFIWWPIFVGILLLLLILIIIIVVVSKKRKMRREIEALLESESELETELMRLGGGPSPYQSFGYLPPTSPAMNDPNLMIGSQTPPPQNSLQLNAGQTQVVQPQQSAPAPVQSVPGNMQPQIPDDFDPDEF